MEHGRALDHEAWLARHRHLDPRARRRRDRADDAMSETTDSVLTAKAKIALFADEQVKGRLITVETVRAS